MGAIARSPRILAAVRWISAAVIVLGLLAIVRALPVARGIELLRDRADGLGPPGMLVFGLAYVMAALLFVPGSALTLAAGAVFGPGWGTLVVSLASTSAAALAFLIARYFAREKVAALARKHPRFHAVDRAIGARGWRIVALLRLSPAMPFSAGNYLYGLTAVRFWPYVAASWLGMLPGTFLYVYLGHAGGAGLSAVGAERGGGRSAGEWAMLAVGLAATVVVTVYVTRVARRALREQGGLGADEIAPDAERAEEAGGGSLRGTAALALAALVVGSAASWAIVNSTTTGP